MEINDITINSEYIQLGQFLKLANIVESGGMVKIFLAEYPVIINNQPDQRRGRKLYPNDLIEIEDIGVFRIVRAT
ncbi:S4 domain-containing protein YaaA [Amphibacillus sediminis]|uniref:S4 domain-containing protein YaaA n=1 Tax=Amphibacillus sediminis TaxID=360185 RepID=UPI0008354827|nr:S4 domain-containing protein YaaA [Amphibacillus sediminis]